jgi:acyl-CoA synthetase (AMP-forming)/AMP-acid ligase II
VLASHPAVDRAVVTGVPDEILGEIGVAVVVPRGDDVPDLGALREHCAQRLADYKTPDALVLVAELPLTPMMKVDPVAVAELAARGAAERVSRRADDRRRGAGMLGSGHIGATHDKERP